MVNFGLPQRQGAGVSNPIAQISTLLDEAVEEMETLTRAVPLLEASLIVAKIREAQAILLGEKPTVPEDN
jgi:hypothetical protein